MAGLNPVDFGVLTGRLDDSQPYPTLPRPYYDMLQSAALAGTEARRIRALSSLLVV